MVKVKKKRVEVFNPVIITLETKDEYDFLLGLLNGISEVIKCECENYSPFIDKTMYDELFNVLKDE